MSAFKLIVTVVDVKELAVTNGAVVNPVAQVLCGNKKKKTKTKAIKPTQPHWNETFEFPFEGDAHEIVVRVVDVKGFNRKSVGQCVIDLKDESILSQVNTEKEIVHDLSDGRAVVGKIKLRCKLTQGVQSKSGGRQPPRVQVPQMSRKNIRQKGSYIPIFEFIRTRDYVGLVEFLQTATPEEVNAQLPKSKNTPLHEACIEREEEILNALLKFHVINLNLKNSDDNTPLHYFCEKWQSPDYLESFTLFIKQGADVNAANSNGETPIFKAIFNNSIRYLLMEALIRNNADVNITTKTAKEGVLHYAVRLGRADLVDLILQARPRLDLKGEEGYTPQELAEVYHHQKIALHLKEVAALFKWLDDNDLSEHKGRFVKNEMTLSLLPHMKDDMLHQMGVESVGARMKILKACEKLECLPAAGSHKAPQTSEAISEDRLNSLENDLRDIDTSGEGIIDGKLLEYTKHLGTGASGDVWKGIFNQVPVAIKVLRVTAEQEIDEFKKEFEVMRTVRNNHVVRFYGASMKPRLCMVMEYCARGSLFHVMKEPSVDIGWDMAVGFCKEMCLGLLALHNNVPLILHRDLKSLNLLVTQDWHIKLCDFGLSRFATPENLDTMKVLRGTFAYCDPEVYNGKIFSTASDIYSLGIITWEIVNRVIKGNYEQPYSEFKNLSFDFQIIIEAAKADLRPTVPEGCPSAYEALIRLCWHKAQGERPTLAQMVGKLEEMEKEIGTWKSVRLAI